MAEMESHSEVTEDTFKGLGKTKTLNGHSNLSEKNSDCSEKMKNGEMECKSPQLNGDISDKSALDNKSELPLTDNSCTNKGSSDVPLEKDIIPENGKTSKVDALADSAMESNDSSSDKKVTSNNSESNKSASNELCDSKNEIVNNDIVESKEKESDKQVPIASKGEECSELKSDLKPSSESRNVSETESEDKDKSEKGADQNSEKDSTVSSKDADVSNDKLDTSKDANDESKDTKDASKDTTDASKDATDASKDSTDASKDSTDTSKDSTNTSKDTTDVSKDTTDASKDTTNILKDKITESMDDKNLPKENESEDKEGKESSKVSSESDGKGESPSKSTPKKKEDTKLEIVKRVTRSSSGITKPVKYADSEMKGISDDDEIEITKEVKKDVESDIEMIEESDPLAISDADVKKAKESKVVVPVQDRMKNLKQREHVQRTKDQSNVIIIDTNTLLKGQGSISSHSTVTKPTTASVSSSAQTVGNSTNNIQTALQAITGGNPAIQGLQSAYLSAIQQVLVAQGGSQVSNPHYIATLQQYYNTLGALQDDAYVIEAPSFIVPYVMEGKPVESIKDFLVRINKELDEVEKKKKKKEEEEKKKEEEEKKKQEQSLKEKDKIAQNEGEKDKENKEEVEKKDEEEKKDNEEVEKKDNEEVEKKDEEVEKKDEEGKKEEEKKVVEEKEEDKDEKMETDEVEEEKKKDEKTEEEAVKDKEDEKMEVDEEEGEGVKPAESSEKSEDKKTEKAETKEKEEVEGEEDDNKENKEEEKTPPPPPKKVEEEEVIDLDSEEKKEDLSHLGRWEGYYKSALGKFFLDLGLSHAQEFIQSDLLKMQKRRLEKMKTNPSKQDVMAVKCLERQLNHTKKRNSHLYLPLKTCRFCSFKTESELVMERHLESPHMVNYTYKCNFCEFETRGPQVILFHTEAEHNVRGRLERAPAFFQCPLCPFEDNNKSKMTRHSFSCTKKFKADKNCDLPDWEPPAKIPKIHRGRPNSFGKTLDALKMPNILPKTLGGLSLNLQNAISSGLLGSTANAQSNANSIAGRGRGRPVGSYKNITQTIGSRTGSLMYQNRGSNLLQPMQGVTSAQQLSIANQVLQSVAQGASNRVPRILPASSAGSLIPGLAASSSITIQSVQNKSGSSKSPQQPSISITPLPRGGTQSSSQKSTPTNNSSNNSQRPAFVICEICDGYIKDLEQLRNHMNLIHKVKIHPKMIYNRPPLNCQKCQHRFFTDQGLERHLLGTHGLVTSSMQEAANKGKDAGRCPICGKVFQWKLLNHVSRDHKMTLKPAHLSYKCTVCTATFNMYRLFENHVYSAHSVVNKNKSSEGGSSNSANATSTPTKKSSTAGSEAPLKINDEITIIPQPASKSPKSESKQSPKKSDSPTMSKEITITKVGSRSTRRAGTGSGGVEVISLDDSPQKRQAEEPSKKRTRETATSKRARTST